MATFNAAQRYARAFFALCLDQDLVEVAQQDMAQLGALIKTAPAFRDFLSSPAWNTTMRVKASDALLNGRINALTLRFIQFLNAKKRIALLPLIVEAWAALYHEHHGLTRVTVQSSIPLRDSQLKEISRRIAIRIGRRVALAMEINPALIGGLKLRVRDRIIDLSIEGQLQRMHKAILQASPETIS